jgi:tellurite resistance protein TerC
MQLNEFLFFSLFIAFIVGMLMLDLGVFSRRNHIVSFKEAGAWSAVWVLAAIVFFFIIKNYGGLIHGISDFNELTLIKDKYSPHLQLDPSNFENSLQIYLNNMSLEFITGYLVEYALSVDNIFVIILIFTSFGVREIYYKKVLFWGILGAILMRFSFIFLGGALIQKAEWVLYVFGGFLIFTGVRMFLNRDEDEAIDPAKHPVVRFAAKHFAVTPRYVRSHFFIKRRGKLILTPLFLVVVIIEFTDLIFAVDSVPAVFSVTKDPYVVFFSNIFAIMGLRSMFFFLTNIMHLFHFLKIGLSALLIFIGAKMLAHHYLVSVGFETQYSLYIIIGILAISIIASLLFPKRGADVDATSTDPVKSGHANSASLPSKPSHSVK